MTPTSARAADRLGRRRGFSLVELMVVVTLIGLAATAVVLTLPEADRRLDQEAMRLAARITLARDETILSGRPTAVRIDADGYAFLRRTDGVWTQLDEAPLKGARWAEGTRPVLKRTEALVTAFDPVGMAEPVGIRLQRGARAVDIAIDASGEVRLDD